MKRIISAMLAVLLCVLVLVGCEEVSHENLSMGSESSSNLSTEESGEADDEALAAKGAELCRQIHGNAVWLQNSADIYDDRYDIFKYQTVEVNGAVILCNANTVFVYDAESGKLRYKAEIGSVMRAEAYSAKDGYDYRLLLNDGVVYRNTADESKVLQEALPLGMQFEPKEPNDEFYDCYDINENYFVWQDDDGIKLLDLAGGEPELILSNSDLAENYKTILEDVENSSDIWPDYMGEMLYGCPRFICGGSKIAITAFKESIIHNGVVIYNISESKMELGHFIWKPDIPQYPVADRYIMDGWHRIDAETGEIYKTAGTFEDYNGWKTADGVTAVFYSTGRNGDGFQGDSYNLQLYLREIDHPTRYFRHIASLADPSREAYFTLLSSDYLLISIDNEQFVVKYSEY